MAEKLRSTRKWRIGRMERLTSYKSECKREMICRYEDCDTCEEHCPHMNEDDCLCLQEVLNKLAEYEDLEEQGKLLKLPCALGDTVYEVQESRKRIQTYIVIAVHVSNCGNLYGWELKDGKGVYGNVNGFSEYAIGKQVFLTKEEAEAALKELRTSNRP